jgi:hypothetical protein
MARGPAETADADDAGNAMVVAPFLALVSCEDQTFFHPPRCQLASVHCLPHCISQAQIMVLSRRNKEKTFFSMG